MQTHSEKTFCVYMTASKPRGVIHTGMTSDLSGRTHLAQDQVPE
jgi:predicted GIY-YIG superfamily endonuclease